MPPIQDNLEAGKQAIRVGDKRAAHHSFLRVLKADPQNQTAWLWLSYLMPTAAQGLACIDRVLAINPQHVQALEARETFRIRLLLEEVPVDRADAIGTAHSRYMFGEALVEAGIILQKQLTAALETQAQLAREGQFVRIGEILMRDGLVRPQEVEAALLAQLESTSNHPRAGIQRFGQFLVERKQVTLAQLHQGLARQRSMHEQGWNRPLGEVLMQLGYIKRKHLHQALWDWQERCQKELLMDDRARGQ